MLNKNIMSPTDYEVPGAQGSPGWTSSPRVLCKLRSESVVHHTQGVFEGAEQEYHVAEGFRGTWSSE